MMIKKIENKIFNITEKWGKKVNLDMSYFVKNGFWMALRQIVIIISGLIVSIFFTRIATKEIYGNYQFFVSIFSIRSLNKFSIPDKIGLKMEITLQFNSFSMVSRCFLSSIFI